MVLVVVLLVVVEVYLDVLLDVDPPLGDVPEVKPEVEVDLPDIPRVRGARHYSTSYNINIYLSPGMTSQSYHRQR